MKVKEIMTTDPIVAEVPGTRADALRLLVRLSVSGLPVVRTRTREIAGVVTRSDIFRKPAEEQLALVMTSKPLVVAPDDEVATAARHFHERRIHTLPVVEGTRLVGVVSPTDVLRVLTQSDGRPIRDLPIGKISAVHQETPLRVVWELMRLNPQNALPVLDANAALVGIVADSDLFRLSDVEETIGKRAIGLPEEDDEWMWDNVRAIAPLYYAKREIHLPARPVREVMTRDVVTAFEKTTVAEAAKKLLKRGVNQLPMLDANDRLVGMITDLDLMRAAF